MIISFNTKNILTNISYIKNKLLVSERTILFIAETWLRQEEEMLIRTSLGPNYTLTHRSSIENYYQAGRPFGGIGWIYNESLGSKVKIEFISNNTSILTYEDKFDVIGTYLPTGRGPEAYESELLQITNTINHSTIDMLLVGDFNGDVMRASRDKPYKTDCILRDWIKEEERIHGLIWISQLYTQRVNHSYKNHRHQSLIDHTMLINRQNKLRIDQVNILNSDSDEAKQNNSDHTPILTIANVISQDETNTYTSEQSNKTAVSKPNPVAFRIDWDSLKHKNIYEKMLDSLIKNSRIIHRYDMNSVKEQDIDELITETHKLIVEARDKSVESIKAISAKPVYMKKPRSENEWWNKDLERIHQLKNKYNKLWLSTRNAHYRLIYNHYRSRARKMEKQAIRKETDRKAKELSRRFKNKKRFWKAIDNGIDSKHEANISVEKLRESYSDIFNNKLHQMDSEKENAYIRENQTYYDAIKRDKSTQKCNLNTTEKLIRSLKRNKAPSVSQINNEEIKFGGKALAILITQIINCSLSLRYISPIINIGLIFPIVKDQKKSTSDLDNTRPITLSEPISSIIEKYLLLKIEERFEEEPTQFGFRQKSSTSHAVFTLKETLNYYKDKYKPIVICFLDFSKAFDKVNRPKLLNKLKSILDPDHWALIFSYYTSTSIKIRNDDPNAAPIKTTVGVKQGGPLSPKLFAIYVNDMSKQVIAAKLTSKLSEFDTGILLYADDTVVCTNSIKSLNEILSIIAKYCAEHEIMINANKTKCIVLNSKQLKDSTADIKINDAAIERVEKFKYLGCWLESNLQNKEHLKSRKQALLAAASKLRKLGFNSPSMSMEVKAFLFETYCRTASMYGLVNAPLAHKDINDLAILENKIIKVAFGLTKYHSTTMLLNAIKIKPLEDELKIRKLQHVNQLLKYEPTARILEHQLENRKTLPNKSLLRYVLGSVNNPDSITNTDMLITATQDKIAEIEEAYRKAESTENADAVNYLLTNNTPRNHDVVKKMLSWQNRTARTKKPSSMNNSKNK
jgi:hypothetical protein